MNPPQTIRAFAAATLDPELLERIKCEQERLASKLGGEGIRWVRWEQVHVTLRFYGNIRAEDLEGVESALRGAVANIVPFDLDVEGVGCFPSLQRPSVIWFGITGQIERLKQLQAAVEGQSGSFGSHSEDRQFQPHLTVGRVKAAGGRVRQIGERIRAEQVGELGRWTVRQITLIQSQLSASGSKYTVLAEIPLGGS